MANFRIKIVDDAGYPVSGTRVAAHVTGAFMEDSTLEEYTDESEWCEFDSGNNIYLEWVTVGGYALEHGTTVFDGTKHIRENSTFSFTY